MLLTQKQKDAFEKQIEIQTKRLKIADDHQKVGIHKLIKEYQNKIDAPTKPELSLQEALVEQIALLTKRLDNVESDHEMEGVTKLINDHQSKLDELNGVVVPKKSKKK